MDLLIRGGLVFDGLGSPPRRLDVGVSGGRVVALAGRLPGPAAEAVDASGLWVTPGFLDIHTHYDVEVEINPGLSESVRHGVTTVVMGNCSLSLTLGDPRDLADIFQRVENIPGALVRRWLTRAATWSGPREYLAHLAALPLGPNVAPLLGHSALRAAAMGLGRSLHERASEGDLARLRRLAEEALDAGCVGISIDMVAWHRMTGRYRGRSIPSHHADYREYKVLADVCRARDAVFQVVPNPARPSSMLDVLRLALDGEPLRTTVLTAIDSAHRPWLWRSFGPLLFATNRLLGGNLRFQALPEPFTIYGDGPVTPLFEEFAAGVELNDLETAAERRALWRSPGFRRRFRRDWTRGKSATFHRDLARIRVVSCPEANLEGRSVAEIAAARGRDALESFMDLLAEHDESLRWAGTGANEREGPLRALLAHEHILPGFTDAGAHARNLAFHDGALSLLRMALRTGFISPERAISRVTGEAARWFRLDAGVVAEGARADLVLLDPEGLRTPGPAPVEIVDPLLDGARRLVKRGSERTVKRVYIGGRLAARDGAPCPSLGQGSMGRLLGLTPEDAAHKRRRLRNRISEDSVEHPFGDYWEVFVLKHQHPGNVALHCLGVLLFYGLLAWAAWTSDWRWLLATPLSQLVGLLGHRLFEWSYIDPRDAIFSVRASRALNRMFARVATGRYLEDVRSMRARLDEHRARRLENATAAVL